LTLAVLPIVLAACGTAGSNSSAAPELPAGVKRADGTTLYAASIDARADRTMINAVDPVSGKRRRTRVVAGRWVIPALVGSDRSGTLPGDGRTALAAQTGQGRSSFALLDTKFTGAARKFTLPGRWSFDASHRTRRPSTSSSTAGPAMDRIG
jgi:hypothetical protein